MKIKCKSDVQHIRRQHANFINIFYSIQVSVNCSCFNAVRLSSTVLPTKISSEDENAVSSYRPELVVAENACVDSELQTLDEISTRLDLREGILSDISYDNSIL